MAKKSVTPTATDHIPRSPTFTFGGEKQPPAFTHGVLTVLNAARDMEAREAEFDSTNHAAAALFEHLRATLNDGGKSAEGAVATLCELLAMHELAGSPNLDAWMPFGEVWPGGSCEIPPEDCMFFEVNGVPYSVEPNLTAREWRDEDTGMCCPVDPIRKTARPISRATFDRLRWELGSEVRAAETREQEVANG
jgi:hypothetical protein